MSVPASLSAGPPPSTVLSPWQSRLPSGWRSPGWHRSALLLWAVVAVVTFVGGSAVEKVGLPAPHLITGLVAGLVVALTGLVRRTGAVLPRVVYLAGQAIAGVLLGTYFSLPALGRVGWALVPLVAVTLLTLLLSVGAGRVLARRTGLDEPTAALGMIAGGSAGIVAAADDLHADARLVAVLQYVRLVLVVLTALLLVRYVLAPHGTYAAVGAKEIEAVASVHSYVLTPLLAFGGAWLATRLRIPAGALIGPLVLTALGGGLRLWNDLQPPRSSASPRSSSSGSPSASGSTWSSSAKPPRRRPRPSPRSPASSPSAAPSPPSSRRRRTSRFSTRTSPPHRAGSTRSW